MQFHGKKPVRYMDRRLESVGNFINWRLEQLKWLHEAGAPAEKREQLKTGLVATLTKIYARKDGWTRDGKIPRNIYWDVVDLQLYQASFMSNKPPGFGNDIDYLLDQHNAVYQSIFISEFKKFYSRPEGPMD